VAKIYKPWHPAKYDKLIAAGIKALVAGEATPHQQKTVLKWIIEEAARTYDSQYFPDSDRDTVFALGKEHVGKQCVKMANISMKVFAKAGEEHKPTEQGG
jgi:hypothetical protein